MAGGVEVKQKKRRRGKKREERKKTNTMSALCFAGVGVQWTGLGREGEGRAVAGSLDGGGLWGTAPVSVSFFCFS